MDRPKTVRPLLMLLAVAAVLVFWRASNLGDDDDAVVSMKDIEAKSLHRQLFTVARPVRMVVQATGSYESGAAGRDQLAAYGWILRADSRKPVWIMEARHAEPGRGLLASVADTLDLPAGNYEAYFAAFGNDRETDGEDLQLRSLFGGAGGWQHGAHRWEFVADPVDGQQDRAARVRSFDSNRRAEAMITSWSAGPLRSEESEGLFEISRPDTLRAYAVGSFEGGAGEPAAWIEEVVSGNRVWEMTEANTTPAGGAAMNRRFEGDLTLPPGVYRAGFQAGGGQQYDDWEANPPLDPEGWGLTLTDRSAGRGASDFDPWRTRTPLVQIARVGDNEKHAIEFRVNSELPVLVCATGEIVHENVADFATLQGEAGQTVWRMTGEHDGHAGGASKNRFEAAFLDLRPGVYTLLYETDDSHAYGSWNQDAPTHPERWGVTIFPLDPGTDSSGVTIRSRHKESMGDADEERVDGSEIPQPPPLPALPEPNGTMLASITQVGNDQVREESFTYTGEGDLHVRALGEINANVRSDYGWITRSGDGAIVWEMRLDNTVPAGGDERNRLADATIKLPAGDYTVHYTSDPSYAYDDFDVFGPDAPDDWGIRVWVSGSAGE